MYDLEKFASTGVNVTLYPNIVFIQPELISFGHNVTIGEFCHIQGGRGVAIGNFVHLAPSVSVAGGGLFIIEDFSCIGAGSRVVAGSELVRGEGLVNPTVPPHLRAVERSYVHIGKHVLIASDVIIHPGVTIGDGAVIGSNSVVTRDVEPWTINVGSPARPTGIRPRKKIEKLAEFAYWETGVDRPRDMSDYLPMKTSIKHVPPDEWVNDEPLPFPGAYLESLDEFQDE
jgi:acetyltransferase-like isoleucine patch superfamily enzyme